MLWLISRGSATAARGTRRLHLQQSVALDLIAKSGVPVLPFQLAKDGTKALEQRLWLSGEGVTVRPQVMDAAGIEALSGGGVGKLQGLQYTAHSPSEATELLKATLGGQYHVESAPTGMVERGISADMFVSSTDARIELDDFAAPRQKDLAALVKTTTADLHLHPAEVEASEAGLFLVKPTLAMATMDAVTAAGGVPANFLDGGGGATAANAKIAINLLAKDPDVRVIFVNIFGGITQTDKVASGIIDAVKTTPRLSSQEVPVVVAAGSLHQSVHSIFPAIRSLHFHTTSGSKPFYVTTTYVNNLEELSLAPGIVVQLQDPADASPVQAHQRAPFSRRFTHLTISDGRWLSQCLLEWLQDSRLSLEHLYLGGGIVEEFNRWSPVRGGQSPYPAIKTLSVGIDAINFEYAAVANLIRDLRAAEPLTWLEARWSDSEGSVNKYAWLLRVIKRLMKEGHLVSLATVRYKVACNLGREKMDKLEGIAENFEKKTGYSDGHSTANDTEMLSAEPWICVVFKGTGPASMAEWLIDATCAQENAQDCMTGSCHQGFYTTLFPANGTPLPVLPYRRITDMVTTIAHQLRNGPGRDPASSKSKEFGKQDAVMIPRASVEHVAAMIVLRSESTCRTRFGCRTEGKLCHKIN
ncbi:succinyl-CoA synthetase-like protein [Pseudohyphozyma bogoriensis]|nr:succinyl-CoA synthetase-like protein [Pseudohyphozyma bogoriensis]